MYVYMACIRIRMCMCMCRCMNVCVFPELSHKGFIGDLADAKAQTS